MFVGDWLEQTTEQTTCEKTTSFSTCEKTTFFVIGLNKLPVITMFVKHHIFMFVKLFETVQVNLFERALLKTLGPIAKRKSFISVSDRPNIAGYNLSSILPNIYESF